METHEAEWAETHYTLLKIRTHQTKNAQWTENFMFWFTSKTSTADLKNEFAIGPWTILKKC